MILTVFEIIWLSLFNNVSEISRDLISLFEPEVICESISGNIFEIDDISAWSVSGGFEDTLFVVSDLMCVLFLSEKIVSKLLSE